LGKGLDSHYHGCKCDGIHSFECSFITCTKLVLGLKHGKVDQKSKCL
jgi:hypothetical protein